MVGDCGTWLANDEKHLDHNYDEGEDDDYGDDYGSDDHIYVGGWKWGISPSRGQT